MGRAMGDPLGKECWIEVVARTAEGLARLGDNELEALRRDVGRCHGSEEPLPPTCGKTHVVFIPMGNSDEAA